MPLNRKYIDGPITALRKILCPEQKYSVMEQAIIAIIIQIALCNFLLRRTLKEINTITLSNKQRPYSNKTYAIM